MKRKLLLSLFVAAACVLVFGGVTTGAFAGLDASSKSTCGPGTIAFRALIGAGERRFSCTEASWYDAGQRQYEAHLQAPLKSHRITLLVVHVQPNGERGELFRRVVNIRDSASRTIMGTLDFSVVYGRSPPAGAPPFGKYLVSIYRGTSVHGQPLAKGQFVVIED
jgi:hypothetical protein